MKMIEQKAKLYDEAIKKASAAYEDEDMRLKATLESIFPELKESEDEKIRKSLINFFDNANKCGENPMYEYGIYPEEILSWLEKQGEIDEEVIAKKFLINKGFPIDANGTFPTFEELYDIIKTGLENQDNYDDNIITRSDEIIQAMSIGLTDMVEDFGWSDFGGLPIEEIQKWLEKQGEQKPYGQRKKCFDCQFNYAGECKGSCQVKRDEQNSAWSEEDEERLQSCLNILQAKGVMGVTETINTKWLKSLKQRIGG
jgi:hypothetical protein